MSGVVRTVEIMDVLFGIQLDAETGIGADLFVLYDDRSCITQEGGIFRHHSEDDHSHQAIDIKVTG